MGFLDRLRGLGGRARPHTDLIARERRLQEQQRLETVAWLAAGIAHDFNNVLQVIRANALALESNLLEAPHLQLRAREIVGATGTAARMLEELRDVGRRPSREEATIDVAVTLRQLEPLLRRAAAGRVALSVEVDAAPLLAAFPEGALEQVVLNLVLNALDATEAGGEIHVAAEADGARVRVTVVDTGTGIDEAVLPSIFEPFFTTKDAGRGTGLGLAVAKDLVERHGGTIGVGSLPGRGTTFAVTLPGRAGRRNGRG